MTLIVTERRVLDRRDECPVPPHGTILRAIPTQSNRLDRHSRHPDGTKEVSGTTTHQSATPEARVAAATCHYGRNGIKRNYPHDDSPSHRGSSRNPHC